MNTDAQETYLIPSCSWCRAQRRCAFISGIGQGVVEASAIELWDRQDPLSAFQKPPLPRVDSDFMSIHATGMYPIQACSWHRAQ